MDSEGLLASLLQARTCDGHQFATDGRAASRITAILPDALGAFLYVDAAYIWLTSPNTTLNGSIPVNLILRSDTDAMKVRRALKKINP